MSFGSGDLGVFSFDMGVDVSFGGVTVRGLLDETDLPAVTSDGAVEGIVHGTTLTISAPDRASLVGLGIDSIITVDARTFAVREFLRVDDGKMWHVMLAESTGAPDPYAGYLFYDSVTRPDESFTGYPGDPSEKGAPYLVTGNFGVSNHRIVPTGGGASDHFVQPLSQSPRRIEARIGSGNWATETPILHTHYFDEHNSIAVYALGGVGVAIIKTVGSVLSLVNVSATNPLLDGAVYNFAIDISSTAFSVTLNGAPVVSCATSALNASLLRLAAVCYEFAAPSPPAFSLSWTDLHVT